jgi:glycosyltransferase involved in cell wall biosynthesis
MKILMLTSEFPPYRGGIATYAIELARAAAELGHDVTVAAPAYHGDQSAIDGPLPFKVVRFPGGANTSRAIIDKTRWTRALAKRESYDVVHAIDWPFFIPLALSGYRKKARCLLTFHGTEVNMMRRRSRAVLLKLMNFWNGWAVSIANSHFTAEHLIATFPALPRETVRAVPLGVRAPDDVQPIGREDARASLSIGKDDVLMVTLGRIVERKGHHVAVEALSKLPPDIRAQLIWYVVGPQNNPEYAGRVRSDAASLDMRTVFTGGVPADDVEAILSAADIFCLPAIWGRSGEFEGFGLVYVEAGLRGVPSIGTQLGGIPDAVIDGTSGLLVPPGDADALAEAITKMVGDPALRRRLAEGALAHARASTWTRVAEETYR